MTFENWLAFVATSCVVLALPGPTAFIILRYAAERGPSARVIAGAVLGDAAALAICNFGLGALLTASSEILTVLKIAAAAYLIGLGALTLCRKHASAGARRAGLGRPFLGVFLVTALNPKGIAFFCALVPQFVEGDAPVLPQLALLQATFCGLSLIAASTWSLVGMSLRRTADGSASGRFVRRGSGLLLIGSGLALATGRLT